MRRAIIHVGMPRTGSTTFQHIVARLRPELEVRGILYPALTPRSAAHEPHLSHQHLGEALDGRRPAEEGAELLERLAGALAATAADVVLLSYEDWIQEKRAAAIAGRMGAVFAAAGFRMEAVMAVKPQSEHLNSLYAHRLQLMREKRLFAAFAARFEGSARFHYDRLLAPWLAACEGRVRAVPVRDARSADGLTLRLLREVGLEERVGALLAGEDRGRVENRSPGPVAVEVSRRLRRLGVPGQLRVRPREMMRVVERLAAERGLDASPFKGVDAGLRARMAERYRPCNDRFAQAVWGAGWDAVVAAEAAQAPTELAGRPIAPELEAAIEEIMQEACAAFGVTAAPPWRRVPAALLDDAGTWVTESFGMSGWRVM